MTITEMTERRQKMRVTQRELAKALGIAPQTVNNVESGYVDITQGEIAAWDKAIIEIAEGRLQEVAT